MAPPVPMTYATGLGPLPTLLEERGGAKAVGRAFAAAGLPLALVEDRAHRVPLVAMIRLFDSAARLAGDTRLGLDTGLAMSPGEYGLWVRFAMGATTLGGAIHRLSRCIVLHQVGGELVLRPRDGGCVLWEYRQAAVTGAAAIQHNEHVLPVMIKVVRAYCGTDWTPDRVETTVPDLGDALAREDAMGAQWRFDAGATGILFAAETLWALRQPGSSVDRAAPISSAEVLAEMRVRQQEDDVARLSAIIALRLLDGRTDIDGAAHVAGLGRRTLQRRLDGAGATYRVLLDRVRMDRADALLRETELSLSEISDLVGYSDPAHFTRAFRRYRGCTPSRVRSRAREA